MNDRPDLLGTGWALPVRLDARGRVAVSSGTERVREALQLLLSTQPGERIMRPDYGCDLQGLVFEPVGAATAHLARFRIEEAIRRWEPRVELDEVRVEPSINPDGVACLVGQIIYRIKVGGSVEQLGFVLPSA